MSKEGVNYQVEIKDEKLNKVIKRDMNLSPVNLSKADILRQALYSYYEEELKNE